MNLYLCSDIYDYYKIKVKEDKMRKMIWDKYPKANIKFFKFNHLFTIARIQTQIKLYRLLCLRKNIPFSSIKLENGKEILNILYKPSPNYFKNSEFVIRMAYPDNLEMWEAKCFSNGMNIGSFENNLSSNCNVTFFYIICTEYDNYQFYGDLEKNNS